jgi:hypothetical protein
MLELLRDGVWQFIGALISLVALAVAMITVVLQVKRKSFAYKVLSDNELLHQKDLLDDRVSIAFDGVPVSSLRLVSLQFLNDGRAPIAKTDFESNIRVVFPEVARVLSASVGSTLPSALPVIVQFARNEVSISPVLLNAADSFTVQIIVSGSTGRPEVLARILDVKNVVERDLASRPTLLRSISEHLTSMILALVLVSLISSSISGFTYLFK